MPLTLSHPAAVLPLRRLGLPVTSMVIGSMVLDLPLYVGSRHGYDIAHSPVGVPTVDVLGTLLALALWFAVLRDPLVDLAPSIVRDRLPLRARLTRRQWRLAPLGAVIGATTHVAWDSFTHSGRWGYEQVAWLRRDHLGLAGLQWSQYVSAVLGLAVVCWFAYAHVRSLAVLGTPRSARVLPPATLTVVVVTAGLVGLVGAARTASVGPHSMAFHGAVGAIITFAVGTAIVCAAWHVIRRRRPAAPVDEA